VEKSSPEEVAALLKGHASLARLETRREHVPPSEPIPVRPSDLSELAEKLHALSSREDGLSTLASMSLTKTELEKLGRIIGVPIMKSDNMERLQEKIIEASIGSRLSSEAIRGDRKTGHR
jgi:hypothetical protein